MCGIISRISLLVVKDNFPTPMVLRAIHNTRISKADISFRFRFFIHQVLQQGKCLESGKQTNISKQQHRHTSIRNTIRRCISCHHLRMWLQQTLFYLVVTCIQGDITGDSMPCCFVPCHMRDVDPALLSPFAAC